MQNERDNRNFHKGWDSGFVFGLAVGAVIALACVYSYFHH